MRVRLDNVCECASSNLAQKDINDIDGIYPIYGACGYIGNVDFYHQEKAYVAVVKDGAGVGRTMLLPGKSSVIGTLQYLIPKGDILPEFLAFAVQSMHLEKYYTGATIPHIYFRDYKKEEFELPNIVEQKEIVNILKKVSGTIELRKQQLEEFDGLIKAQFVEMFGDNTEFGKWKCCTVGDVADVCVGVVIKPTQYYTDKGVPAFRSLNIGVLCVKDVDWVYFTEEGHKKNQKSVVKENDVLVIRSGNPGTACVADARYAGYNAVDIIVAHPDEQKVNSVFLATFTNMPHGMNQIREKTGGAAQQHFNVAGYKALRLILPPIELQRQFAAFVQQVDKSKFA